MAETSAPIEAQTSPAVEIFETPTAGKAEPASWILPAILLVLVPTLVAVAVFSRQPPSVWSTTDIVLCVLTALLCTLVAASLALTGCGRWLTRIEQDLHPLAADLLAVHDAQARLCDIVDKSNRESNTRALQEEKNRQLLQDGLVQLTSQLQAVVANVSVFGEGLRAQSETSHAALAALTRGHGQLTDDVRQLQTLTQTVAGRVVDAAEGQTEARGALQENGRVMAATAEAIEQSHRALRAELEKLAEAVRQTGAAVTTGAAEQTAARDAAGQILAEVAGVGTRQTTLGQAVQESAAAMLATGEAVHRSQATLQAEIDKVADLVRQTAAGVTALAAEQPALHAATGRLVDETTQAAVRQTALRDLIQARAEAADRALAVLTTGQTQLAGHLEQLEQSAREVTASVAGVAQGQAALHDTCHDQAEAVRAAVAARQQDHEALQTRVEALADTAGQTIAAVSGMVVEQTAARETTRRMIGEVANAAIAALTAGQGRLTHDLQELQQWTQAAVDDGPPAARPPVPAAAPAAGLRLSAAQAAIHGAELRYEAGPDRDSLGYWTRADDWAQWQLVVPQPGRFQVRAEIAALAAGRFEVAVGDQVLEGHAPTTADYGRFETVELGTVELPVPGPTHLAVRPIPEGWQPMNLKALDLVPVTSSSA